MDSITAVTGSVVLVDRGADERVRPLVLLFNQELFGVAALFGGGSGQFAEDPVAFIVGSSGKEQFGCQTGTTSIRPEAESPEAINDDRTSFQV